MIYGELGDKFGWSVRLYVGAAACAMRAGDWEEAERLLNDAYAKDPKSADCLANLAAVGLHLGKATVSRTLKCAPRPRWPEGVLTLKLTEDLWCVCTKSGKLPCCWHLMRNQLELIMPGNLP